MSLRNIPFSALHFFSYFAPGTVLMMNLAFSQDLARLFSALVVHRLDASLLADLFFVDVNAAIKDNLIIVAVVCVFSAYVIGHIISAIAKTLVQAGLIDTFLGTPEQNLFRRTATPFFLFSGYQKTYTPDFRDAYEKLFRKKLRIKAENPEDMYVLSRQYVAQNHQSVLSMSSTFMHLYYFSRNLAVAYALSVPTILALYFQPMGYLILIPAATYSGFAAILLANALNFYRASVDEVFRAAYVQFLQG